MTDHDPFGDKVLAYRNAGWSGTLPLPLGEKSPPPSRYTGADGYMPSDPDIYAWLEISEPRNIALRLERTVIGIDVDAYDGRAGGETLSMLAARLGGLPPTWRSTSRVGMSGVYLFRVPSDVEFADRAGEGIDIIRWNHRYVVAPPSVHPSGAVYFWEHPEHGISRYSPPDVFELPELPSAWVDYLKALSSDGDSGDSSDDDDPFAHSDRVFTQEQAVSYVRPALERLRTAATGEINNRLNDAAKTLSHFGDEFWTKSQAVRKLHNLLAETAYDGKTWKATDTIESAYRSAEHDWKAILAPSAVHSGDEGSSPGGEPENEFPSILVDLGPYLDGTVERPQPAVGIELPGGMRMLYPGKVHSLIGETETGKSWLALMLCAEEVKRGNHAVYLHWEEADPSGTIERLLLMGTDEQAIRERFHFAGPESRISEAAVTEIASLAPSLVINDGINDAMAIHGWGINEAEGVSLLRRRIARPFTDVGAAVLELDHVTKSVDTRGRDAFGSVHKGNGLDGARFALEMLRPFGRGRDGESRLYVTKDRPGWLREHGRPDRSVPGKTQVGRLCVNAQMDEWGIVKAQVLDAEPEADGQADSYETTLDQRVIDYVVAKHSQGVVIESKNFITDNVEGNRQALLQAVNRLIDQGKIIKDGKQYRLPTGSELEGSDASSTSE